MSSASKDDLTKFAFSVTEDTFAVDLIATLAKAFLRTQDRRQQVSVWRQRGWKKYIIYTYKSILKLTYTLTFLLVTLLIVTTKL